jgi:hypothetical protein
MKEERTVIWTMIPATLFLLLGFGCINEGDVRASLVAFIFSFVCCIATIILNNTKKEPSKNVYTPKSQGTKHSKKKNYYEGRKDSCSEI